MAKTTETFKKAFKSLSEKGLRGSIDVIVRRLRKRARNAPDFYSEVQLKSFTSDRLMAIMRNDAHRIEKAYYNDNFAKYPERYERRRDQVLRCISELSSRGDYSSEPTVEWARTIAENYDTLDESYIESLSTEPPEFTPDAFGKFLDFIRTRRSVRVWSEQQPSSSELREIVNKMIEAGGLAPSSGNRQGLRYIILQTDEQKALLRGLKERHCYEAPITILVVVDKDTYYDIDTSLGRYVDSGLAIMCMILAAHSAGVGTTVNHFMSDLTNSWSGNPVRNERFKKLKAELNLTDNLEPIALVNVGLARFIPPTPTRCEPAAQVLSA